MPDGCVALANYLSVSPNRSEVLVRLKVHISQGKLEHAIRHWTNGSNGPLLPYEFVLTLKSLMGTEFDWSLAVNSLKEAFVKQATADVSRAETLYLLMAIGTLVPKAGSADAITALVSDGSFGEAVAADADNSSLAAAMIAAILGYAPNVSLQSLATSARRGDKILSAMLSGTGANEEVISKVRVALQDAKRLSQFLHHLAVRDSFDQIGAKVLNDAIGVGAKFNVRLWTLLRVQPLLVTLASYTDVQPFFDNIDKTSDLLTALNKGEVTSSNSFTYLMAGSTMWGTSSRALRNRLQKYVESADAGRWSKVIEESEAASDSLLKIVAQLELLGLTVRLGAPVSDAIVEEARRALLEGSAVRPRTGALAETLDEAVFANLPARLWPAILDAKSAGGLSSLIAAFGKALVLSSSVSLANILNGPAAILLAEPGRVPWGGV